MSIQTRCLSNSYLPRDLDCPIPPVKSQDTRVPLTLQDGTAARLERESNSIEAATNLIQNSSRLIDVTKDTTPFDIIGVYFVQSL